MAEVNVTGHGRRQHGSPGRAAEAGPDRVRHLAQQPVQTPRAEEPERYEIRIEGILDENWSCWFDGLSITSEPAG